MIKSLTVTNPKGESLVLELARPGLSGFAVRNIDGLGAGEAVVNMTDIVTNDGAVFNSSRRSFREIVIDLIFLWNPTIEDSRQKTYKYFPIGKKVTLIIETDNRTLTTEGYVAINQPEIFSSQEGCSITIRCEDPNLYLYGDSEIVSGQTVIPLFEFPFMNNSVNESLIMFGSIRLYLQTLINYIGDIDVGLVFTIHATGSASGLRIFNAVTRESMALNSTRLRYLTGQDISAGDTIVISTEKANKYVHLIRDGQTINILNCLGMDTDWFTLTSGDNLFLYTLDSGATNLEFSISYRTAYEGI